MHTAMYLAKLTAACWPSASRKQLNQLNKSQSICNLFANSLTCASRLPVWHILHGRTVWKESFLSAALISNLMKLSSLRHTTGRRCSSNAIYNGFLDMPNVALMKRWKVSSRTAGRGYELVRHLCTNIFVMFFRCSINKSDGERAFRPRPSAVSRHQNNAAILIINASRRINRQNQQTGRRRLCITSASVT